MTDRTTKFRIGDMVQTKKDALFLKERIEGIVVGIKIPSWGNQSFRDELNLYIIQDRDGAHYEYIAERWLEVSDAPRFEPKKLQKGSMVTLSPHSKKKRTGLDREKYYLVEKVEDSVATIILEDHTERLYVEDLKIV